MPTPFLTHCIVLEGLMLRHMHVQLLQYDTFWSNYKNLIWFACSSGCNFQSAIVTFGEGLLFGLLPSQLMRWTICIQCEWWWRLSTSFHVMTGFLFKWARAQFKQRDCWVILIHIYSVNVFKCLTWTIKECLASRLSSFWF